MLDIDRLMEELARGRPAFHSEADFQHALAWRIREAAPDCRIRLEHKPFPDERMYLDLWLPDIGVALELKYLTRKLAFEHGDESFALTDQEARDQGRYDFLKDVQRLERCGALPCVRAGIAVLLTNDSGYWKRPRRHDTNDAAFRLHDGRAIAGNMAWSERAGPGTTKGRKDPIRLAGSYRLRWRDYADLGEGKRRLFRYLAVRTSP